MSTYRRFTACIAAVVAVAATLAPSAAQAGTTPSHIQHAGAVSAEGIKPAGRTAHPQTTVTGTLSVTLNVAGTNAFSAAATTTATDSAGAATFTYSYNWGDGSAATATATHTYATVGEYIVTVSVTDNLGSHGTDTFPFSTWGVDYNPYGPVRILDTRGGIGAPATPVASQGTVKLQVTGAGPAADPIPETAFDVVLNVTVTNATGNGFITVYDDNDAVPITTNVNYVKGQTVPNLVIVPVSANGVVDLFNGGSLAGKVDLIADVTGYFTPTAASGYTPVTPDRLLDTRSGTGAAKAPVPANGTVGLQVAGADGGALPASGITAVALNVTVTDTAGNGVVTVYPDAGSVPTASNLNYVKGQTVANSVIVPVAADGKVDLANSGGLAGTADLIADVVGYYSPSGAGAFAPIDPVRILDTRDPAKYGGDGPLAANSELAADTGIEDPDYIAGFPDTTAFVYNATVTDTQGSGFLTVYPDAGDNAVNDIPTAPPNTSALNWVKGGTVPNLVQATPGTEDGYIDFFNGGTTTGTIDLILDESGFYEG